MRNSGYNNKTEDIKKLIAKKNKIIALRNKMDLLEQETEQYRSSIELIWKSLSEDEIDEFNNIINDFKKAFLCVQKKKQNWLIRLSWAFLKGNRIVAYESQIPKMSRVVLSLNLKDLPNNYIESDAISVEKVLEDARGKIENLYAFQEYKDLLLVFESEERIEQIDSMTFNLRKQVSEIAISLWEKWLIVKPADLLQIDRQEITSYLATLRLYTSAVDDETASYNSELNSLMGKVRSRMSKYLPCWAATSLSVNRKIPFESGIFDLLVVDEASQCDIASVLPLLYRAKNAVIIGDPKQLSHITGITNMQDKSLLMKYKVPFEWSYKAISLFDLANSMANPQDVVDLRDHHRSHADIINFSNQEFYNGRLRVATRYSKLNVPEKEKAGIRWIQVSGTVTKPSAGGAINIKEAQELVKAIRHLVFENKYQGSIGAVTPFRAQADYIRKIVAQDTDLMEKLQTNNDFLVDTVHKFQGDERDIMLFSPVISTGISVSALGFLANTGNLFNVAITRARTILIVVGDRTYCSNCEVKYLEHFATYSISLERNIEKAKNKSIHLGLEYPVVPNLEMVSEWEKILYSGLYKAGIYTTPQYPVEKYSLDLALFDGERCLDIEVDGEMYHKDWNGELCYRDQLRNHRLYEQGWDVIRFWVYQVRDDMDWCINEIESWKLKK